MGTRVGTSLRSAILQDRDALVAQGKDNAPRDSEMSVG